MSPFKGRTLGTKPLRSDPVSSHAQRRGQANRSLLGLSAGVFTQRVSTGCGEKGWTLILETLEGDVFGTQAGFVCAGVLSLLLIFP